MGTLVVVLLGGAALFGAITYHRKWTYLWREWICSVDHKRGVMYIIMALVMLLRGFADAIMMRTQQAIAVGDRLPAAAPLRPDLHRARRDHDLLRGHAVHPGLDERDRAAADRRARRGVPFVNSLSFWLSAMGAVLVMMSMFVGDFAATGWVAAAQWS
jgi:cytochrome o ubiquinol oxidase subunit 1